MERNGYLRKELERVDMGALNGLRGIFAFHVMVFHACIFLGGGTYPKLNLYANVDMPLFFLLSGFSLVLAYGRTTWDRSSLCCISDKTKKASNVSHVETLEKSPKIFNAWEFYKKRLIRILPLHYLGTILVLIVWNFGYYWFFLFLSIFIAVWLIQCQMFLHFRFKQFHMVIGFTHWF